MPRHRTVRQLPPHITAAQIPAGIYWDASGNGRWYVFDVVGGRRKVRRVAGPDAKLSELHAIAEERRGAPARGTVQHVLDAFHASPQFAALADRTKADYQRQRELALALPTKLGPFGQLEARRLRVPLLQVLLDRIGADTPTKANHLLRYLRRVFRWSIPRGHLVEDPTRCIRLYRERRRRRLPDHSTIAALTAFAQQRGALRARTAGSVSPYLWICIEIGYLCRLRPVETVTLTEAAAEPEGIRTNRRKGSRDSLVLWTPRLRAVWDAALALRTSTWAARRVPVPMRHQDRLVVVGDQGGRITDSALQSAWQRLLTNAHAAGIITPDQRFGLHDLKRRGITDTEGRDAKLAAGGHRSAQMLDVYDLEVPAVQPAPGAKP